MKISVLSHPVWRALFAIFVGIAVLVWQQSSAKAFGGVWSATDQALQQTDEQLILIDNQDSTVTAIVQLQLDGPAQELTWVIPAPAESEVGFSSNTLFQRLVTLTTPQYWVDASMPCMGSQADNPSEAGAPDQSPARAKIVDHAAIQPIAHETLSIAADSDDVEAAVRTALSEHGYASSERSAQQLAPYVRAGLSLLALKLKKEVGNTFVRPLIITYPAAEIAIPIRATAAAARPDMPLRIWMFGQTHAVPTNYKTLIINDALFNWQSVRKFAAGSSPANGAGSFGPLVPVPSNYDAVVSQAANAAQDGQGFTVEYTAPTSHVRSILWNEIDAQDSERIKDQSDGSEVLKFALQSYSNWAGLRDVIQATTQLPPGVSLDQLIENPAALSGMAKLDTARFLEQLDSQVLGPVRDSALLLRGTPYMTQLFTTLSADEMTLDPTFGYNFDLALVNNVRIAKQRFDCDANADPRTASWRIELPQGGAVLGRGLDSWPITTEAMPANLKIVQLTSQGSGDVIEDNSRTIGSALFEATGTNGSGAAIPEVPQNGRTIGASQTIVPQLKAGAHSSLRGRDSPRVYQDVCSVALPRSQTETRSAWLCLGCAVLLVLRRAKRRAFPVLLALALSACSEGEAARSTLDAAPEAPYTGGALTAQQLRDPESCKDCHPSHYREWSGSMHAFASRDPVFRAMNRRGQRETQGELGEFCVNCHAPMAVRDKLTGDGLNLDELGHEDRGVTCYFCHSVVGVDETHNAQLRLGNDTTLRGPFDQPLATAAHGAQQSKHFDENAAESSQMCGACHDIVMPKGVAIERTFREYEKGLFAKVTSGIDRPFGSCVGCHMQGRKGVVASVPGAQERIVHEHFWPGIDVAFGDFPHREAMRSAIEDCQLGNASVSYFSLEVSPPNLFTFQIETNAGHSQPSGASQDRRMWLEFLAYDADGKLIEEASSGNIADGELEEKPIDHPKHDPQLILFGDRLFDEDGKRVHMFWDAAKSAAYPKGYESVSLPGASTTYIEGKHAIVKQLRAAGMTSLPARVTARLRIRPIGVDVLDDLVHSGDLDPAIAAEMPTLSFGAQIEWTQANGTLAPVYSQLKSDCSKYRCLLDPTDADCK